jgi:prepilin-type N-terminal cleavage/methylation domain-containing protein
MKRTRIQQGFSLVELIVAMGVLALLLSLFGASLYQTRTFSHALWTRQHCIAAAQATLDSLSVQQPLTEADTQRLWPRIELTTSQMPGQGVWQGFTLVTVTGASQSYRRNVQVTLSRYMAPGGAPGGDS